MAVLIPAAGTQAHCRDLACVAAQLEHFGFGIRRVAAKDRCLHRDTVHIPDAALTVGMQMVPIASHNGLKASLQINHWEAVS